jgi:hypothetical protein
VCVIDLKYYGLLCWLLIPVQLATTGQCQLVTRLLSLRNTLERLPMSASSAYELPEFCVIPGFRSGAKEFCALLAL